MGRPDPGKQASLRQRLKRSLDSISVRQKIAWAFAIIIFLTVIARGFSFMALWNYRNETRQLLKTYNLVRDAEELDERLSWAEGDIRGYVISGNQVFLGKIDEHYRVI